MSDIRITPANIRQFGAADGATFCLVTNPDIIDRFDIVESPGYAGFQIIPFTPDDSFEALLQERIPEKAHVLVVSPFAFFKSPPQDKLGARRKLVAMACNSTPTDFETIKHFLAVLERTDPDAQQAFADRFFDVGSEAEYLRIVDPVSGTEARFDHLDESYFWSEQCGPIEEGQQQLAPPGEISVLPLRITDFDSDLTLAVNGTIAFQGYPILHNGAPSFTRADQARLHEKLSTMEKAPIIATVRDGEVERIDAPSPEAQPAADVLNAMFELDSRYRKVWELGFAINTTLSMYPGNAAMNETFGGTGGTLHFGLGLTPYTQYHLDIICPNTAVLTNKGETLIAGLAPRTSGSGMSRNKNAGCACLEG